MLQEFDDMLRHLGHPLKALILTATQPLERGYPSYEPYYPSPVIIWKWLWNQIETTLLTWRYLGKIEFLVARIRALQVVGATPQEVFHKELEKIEKARVDETDFTMSRQDWSTPCKCYSGGNHRCRGTELTMRLKVDVSSERKLKLWQLWKSFEGDLK